MEKIERLTPEQEALLPVYRDKWLKIGLNTEPCDRAKAEAAAIEAYIVAGITPPKRFVWCDSPLSLVLVGATLKDSVWASVRDSVRDSVWDSVWASVRDSVRDSVWDSVWASVRDSVRDSVWDSVWASVRDSVGDSVWDSVWDSVGDSVWASVRDSVRASVWASVRDSVRDSVGDSVYGSQDAHWLGFYEFFLEALNLEGVQKLRPLMTLAKDCGWWIPRKNICLLSEKPVQCNLQDGVIHAEDAPAVAYKDGFSVWAINGVMVDEQIVMKPETQTLKQINSEDNEEVKRIRIERYGWTKYLAESNAKVLDTKVIQLNSGTTWMESLMVLDNLSVLCTYDPSTGRPYALEVDPECKTCEQAQRYLQAPEEAFSGFAIRPTETYPVLRT